MPYCMYLANDPFIFSKLTWFQAVPDAIMHVPGDVRVFERGREFYCSPITLHFETACRMMA